MNNETNDNANEEASANEKTSANEKAKDNHVDFSDTNENSVNFSRANEIKRNDPDPSPEIDNRYRVQIHPNQINHPVVLLIGPPSSGKTVSLIRLARYINTEVEGYDVIINRDFISDNSTDQRYEKAVDEFETLMHDVGNKKPNPTKTGAYILLNIRRHQKVFCHIVEAPGEHYFDENKTNQGFKDYLAAILEGKQRVIFAFLFDRKYGRVGDLATRYDQRMSTLLNRFKSHRNNNNGEKIKGDDIILIYNKIDLCKDWRTAGGLIDENQAKQDLSNRFPILMNNILEIRRNAKRTEHFTVFEAGTFEEEGAEDTFWIQGVSSYPQRLWNTMQTILTPETPWLLIAIVVLLILISIVGVILMVS
jgi:hypothetical protein